MTPAATLPGFPTFFRSLRDLFAAERGHATYEVNEAGELVHVSTVITEKQLRGESLEDFHDRVRSKHHFRKGDVFEVLNNGGRFDTIRLTLKPRD